MRVRLLAVLTFAPACVDAGLPLAGGEDRVGYGAVVLLTDIPRIALCRSDPEIGTCARIYLVLVELGDNAVEARFEPGLLLDRLLTERGEGVDPRRDAGGDVNGLLGRRGDGDEKCEREQHELGAWLHRASGRSGSRSDGSPEAGVPRNPEANRCRAKPAIGTSVVPGDA